jgi:ABC-type glycerol-3-phosphate transport system substrate-binding protein
VIDDAIAVGEEIKPMTRAMTCLLSVLLICLAIVSVANAAPVKVVHVMANHGEPFFQFLKERAVAFHETFPEVEVEVLAQQGDYTTKVQLMIAGGSQVDVLDSTSSFMAFAGADCLADLMPCVKAERVNLDREMLGFARRVLMKGDRLLGIPSQLFGVVAAYNRTYFDEMGVAPLRSLGGAWNWDWLRANAARLTKASGDGVPVTWGVSFSTALYNLAQPVHQAGGSMFDAYLEPRRALMTTEPVREGLGFYVELCQRDWGVPRGAGAGFYTKREAAITLAAAGANYSYFASTSDDFEAVVQPKGPVRRGGTTVFGPYHVPAASEQQAWAFRWISFLAFNEESQVQMMRATGRIPGHYSTLRKLEQFLGSQDSRTRSFLIQVRDASTDADGFPRTLTRAEGAINRFFAPAFNQVLNGGLALDSFLENMQTQMQVELDKLYVK